MLANFCGVRKRLIVRGDRCRREFFSRHLKIGILYFSGYFIFPFISNSTSYLDSDRNSNRNQFPNFDMYYTTRSKNAARRNVTCSPSDTSPSPWNPDGRISSGINDSHVSTINYGAFTTNGGKASGTGDGQGEDALRRRHFDNWKPMRRQWEGFQAKNQPFRPSFGP